MKTECVNGLETRKRIVLAEDTRALSGSACMSTLGDIGGAAADPFHTLSETGKKST